MIVFGVAVVAIIGFFGLRQLAQSKEHWENKSSLKIGSILCLLVGILVPLMTSFVATFRQIPSGCVGVSTMFGAVRKDPLPEGFNITMPLVEVTNMSIQIQRHETNYLAASKDLQVVHVEMILNFRLRADKAPEVFQKVGVEYPKIIIEPAAQEVVKAEMALHNAMEILSTRPKVKDAVQDKLKVWLDKYGIELNEVSLANIKFDPAYEKAIETKQIKEQEAEQKKYELLQAQKEAEIVTAKAKGLAEARIMGARADADSKKISADAEAEYNKKVAQSITPEIIKMEYLKRWDGKLPGVLTDSKSGMLFTVDTTPEKSK